MAASERMPFDLETAAGECAERFHQEKVAELVVLKAGRVRFVSTDPIEAARSSYVDVSDDDVRRVLAGGAP